jgi:autotransporter-associated beta strand protein
MERARTGKFRRNSFSYLCSAGLWFSIVIGARAQQPAFPGAEGFGAYALGGRSGAVYHVTNLNNSGSGSFRDAVSQPNRTIVFDVSGIINVPSNSPLSIAKSNITVAGQTAPGDGITLKGGLTSVDNTRNVIVRFLHCRPGDVNCPNFQEDSFHVNNGSNVVVDHVSASWCNDEVLSVTHSTNVTVQWCMISEPLDFSCHDEGSGVQHHGYGSLLRYGAGGVTYHHNLYAHNKSRNPRLGDSIHLDFVNNVIYNWGDTCGYNGNDAGDNPNGFTNYLNYVNNYLIVGTNTTQNPPQAFKSDSTINPASAQIYQSGNLIDTNKNGVLDGFDKGWSSFTGNFTTNATRFAFPQVSTDSATTAYARVLSAVGASVARDAVDARIVSNVIQNTGGIINSQNEVGGWPTVNSLPAPTDTDQDGMPDFWEVALGLSTNNAADRNNLTSDGYTRLEQYLNWLAGPHARVQTNSIVYVDLRPYAAGLQDPAYAVFNATNGTVALLGDDHIAQFTPTPGFSGLASFLFTADGYLSSLTGTVSVVVTPLVVTTNLVWRGDGTTNNWDVATTANWLIGTNAVEFLLNDNVTFNDTGSNSPAINLVGTLLPSSVTVGATQNYTFGGTGSLGGLMRLIKSGSGQLTVTTSNTFSGGTTVSNGTLLVNSTAGSGTGTGAVTVVSGATLGGSGIIGGPVTVNGTLAPGNGVGTLTISNGLAVNGVAALQYALGTNSDRTVVSSNLTLGGTLNVSDAGGLTNTTYTVFTYGGALTYNGVTIGATPTNSFSYAIDTNTAGVVKLDVTTLSPPVALFTASPIYGAAPLAVTFTDSSTGPPTGNRHWDFGDGALDTTETNFVHNYAAGTYAVSLTVTNSAGTSSLIRTNYITALSRFDWWRSNYFGCVSCPQAAASADPDGDGMNNTNEFVAGTNPTNSFSALRIISVVQQSNDVNVTWTTAGGRTNAVQATAGDGAGGYSTNFADISGPIIIPGSVDTTTNYVDVGGGTNSPARYYRVRLVP